MKKINFSSFLKALNEAIKQFFYRGESSTLIKSKISIIEFYNKWAAIVVTMAIIGLMKSAKRLVNKK